MNKFQPNKNVYQDMNKFEKDYWWYQGLRNVLNYYVKSLKPAVILDAGCGTGANMEEIKNDFNQVYGIDISEEAISFCKKKGLNNLYLGSLQNLPFNDSFFDLIYCFDVFGNIDAKETNLVLTEFKRCLKTNGNLIIQTAALPWLTSKHDEYWDIQKRYKLNELAKTIEENNLKVIKKSYRHFFLFPIIAIVKLVTKNKKQDQGDFTNLPYILNFLLFLIMKVENFLLRFINFPIGSTVFIISKK